jgi:hypothetical protein
MNDFIFYTAFAVLIVAILYLKKRSEGISQRKTDTYQAIKMRSDHEV